MTHHISVDLETMGTSPDAAIIAIGAIEFEVSEDLDTAPRFGSTFYINVDLQSSINNGLKVDASTVYWWLQQSDEARAALTKSDPVPMVTALNMFDTFWRTIGATKDTRIWARGQDFDISIMRTAYGLFGGGHPWKYNMARDSRTLYEAVGFDVSSIPPIGTAHNALDDAIWEARAIAAALQAQKRMRYDLMMLSRRVAGITEPADDVMSHLIGSHGRPMPFAAAPAPGGIKDFPNNTGPVAWEDM